MGVLSFLSGFRDNLVRDAAEEGVGARGSWTLLLLPLVGGTVLLLLYLVSRSVYYWLLRDDHPVEWTQFLLLVYATPISVMGAVAATRRRHRLTAAFLVAAAVGLVFLGGEEVSWGQRIFGFADVVAGNRQGELNIHNLAEEGGIPVEQLFRAAEALVGLVGAVLPFLVRWRPPRLTGPAWRVITPPLFLVTAFLGILVYRAQRFAFHVQVAAIVSFQEWAELCLYLALAVWVTLIYLRESNSWVTDGRGSVVRSPDAVRPLAAVGGAALVITGAGVLLTIASGVQPGNV